MPTFAELFCERYRVAPENFSRAVFWRCLHRRTWLLVPLLRLDSDYFAPDLDLIRDIGRLTRASGLPEDLADFYSHPRNNGFLHRRLRLRLSVGRVTRLVHQVFAEAKLPAPPPVNTGAPFRT